MILNLKPILGLLALVGAHLSLRSCLDYSSYTSINDRLANIQTASLVHETGIVEKALRCYSEDPDTNNNRARIAQYLLANRDNKFVMFLKGLGRKEDIRLLAHMMMASLDINGYELEAEDQRLTIKPHKAGEELSIQLCDAFDTEDVKLADVLRFFFSKGAEARETMQMSEYIQTKNFLLHAFLGEYCENGDIIKSMDRMVWGLLVESGGYYEHGARGSSPSGILRGILAHAGKSLSSHNTLKNDIDHSLGSGAVFQQLCGSYGRQALPALFRERSLYDYEDKDVLSILLLGRLDTDERRLEALDLMFPASACKGEILGEVAGHMGGKGVGDPISYLHKRGSEDTWLPQKTGRYLFEHGLVNMFLHWSRTGDASLIRDVDDEITLRNYARMARWSDPKEVCDLVEKVKYNEGELSSLFSEEGLLALCWDSVCAYNSRNYEKALKNISEAAGRSEWCMSRLCMIYLKLGRYYEFRECYGKLRNKGTNPGLSRMVEELPAAEDEPRMDLACILNQVSGTIPAEGVRRICDMAVKVLANCDNVVHVRGEGVMVVGDTHGHLDDVARLVGENWEKGRIFVFNGDFVDRGSKQALNFLFLLLLKINFPDRVFLNRGNHEDPDMNRSYGLSGELKKTYGDRGEYVLACFTDVYAVLPMATVINEEVFVVHGGLHNEPISIERDVQPAKRNVAWQNNEIFTNFLWSSLGPHTRPNTERGAGFYFGPEVTEAFLQDNNLKLVVRGHRYIPEGYKTDHGGNVAIVHSAPGYMGREDARGRYLLFYHGGEEGLQKVTHNGITYFVGEMAPADQ
jgi:serine/threonine-protein phosphatase 5